MPASRLLTVLRKSTERARTLRPIQDYGQTVQRPARSRFLQPCVKVVSNDDNATAPFRAISSASN